MAGRCLVILSGLAFCLMLETEERLVEDIFVSFEFQLCLLLDVLANPAVGSSSCLYCRNIVTLPPEFTQVCV